MIKALSFSGAGFCGVYHLGATHALSKRLNFDELKFTGASAGSIAAGIQINILLSNILQQYIDIANININIEFLKAIF